MKRRSRLLASAAVLLTLTSGCFTGVESTPRITAGDVKREKITEAPEDTFLLNVGGEPLAQWNRGKLFYVTEPKINLIFGSSAPKDEDLTGKWLRFDRVIPVTGITGQRETQIEFLSPRGQRLAYRLSQSPEKLVGQKSVEVPFTIEKSMIDTVASMLVGKRLYVTSNYWRDDDDRLIGGRKFVPVHIDAVTAGNTVYPIKVSFTEEQTHRHARLFLAPGSTKSTPRGFASMFSFTDPRKKYPSISDKNWQLIQDGRVGIDMTREECRLSLGSPKEVDRRPGYSVLREVWVYENGIYLVFEDGLLQRYRY